MKKINVGITGCTGTLGRLTTKKIDKEKHVSYSCFKGDITNKNDINEWLRNNTFDSLIHYAAIVPTKEVDNDMERAIEVNKFGTQNLIESLIEFKSSAWLFYSSTSHVYDFSSKAISESCAIKPISGYGQTKLMGEKALQKSFKFYKGKLCIGRIFSFFHESQEDFFLYPQVKKRLQNHNPKDAFELNGAENIRDFLNAEEIVDIIFKLMKIEFNGIINIGSGIPVTIQNFVREKFRLPDLQIINLSYNTNSLYADVDKMKSVLKK